MTSSAIACAVLMVYAVIRWKPQPFGPLLAVTASQITWIVADILGAIYGKTILPVQFMYFAGYFPLLVAVIILAKRWGPKTQDILWIDTAMVVVAATTISGDAISFPALMNAWSSGENLSASIANIFGWSFQLLDAVTIGIAIRMTLSRTGLSIRAVGITAGIGFCYLGDLFWQLPHVANGASFATAFSDVLFHFCYIAFVFGICYPEEESPAGTEYNWRRETAMMTVAMLVPPVAIVFLVFLETERTLWFAGLGCLAMSVLAADRMRRLMRTASTQAETLQQHAFEDPLTGLANRRRWNEWLIGVQRNYTMAQETARATNGPGPQHDVMLAIIDLDHFKKYNDQHGHMAGDVHLETVAKMWQDITPADGLLARHGGEEFAVAVPDRDLDEAQELLLQFLALVPNGQTCSIGMTFWNPSQPVAAAMMTADRALYQAKDMGRNRVVVNLSPTFEPAPTGDTVEAWTGPDPESAKAKAPLPAQG